MTEKENSNVLQTILSQALETLKAKYGNAFSLKKVDLAELQRMTEVSRSRLRHLQKSFRNTAALVCMLVLRFLVGLPEYLIHSSAKALGILRYVLKDFVKSSTLAA